MKTNQDRLDTNATNRKDRDEREFSDFHVVIELDETQMMQVAGGILKLKIDH